MPAKTTTHKPVAAPLQTYDDLQTIAKQLSVEKSVRVSMSATLKLIVDYWKAAHKEAR